MDDTPNLPALADNTLLSAGLAAVQRQVREQGRKGALVATANKDGAVVGWAVVSQSGVEFTAAVSGGLDLKQRKVKDPTFVVQMTW